MTDTLEQLRAELSQLRAEVHAMGSRQRLAEVVDVDPVTGTATLSVPGRDGTPEFVAGVPFPAHFLPDVGAFVQLDLQGSQPVPRPQALAVDAVSQRELAPDSVGTEQMVDALIASLTDTTVYYQPSMPVGADVGDLWLMTPSNVAHRLMPGTPPAWEAVRDEGIAQALLDAKAAADAADLASGDALAAHLAAIAAQAAAVNAVRDPSFEDPAAWSTVAGWEVAADLPRTGTRALRAPAGTTGAGIYQTLAEGVPVLPGQTWRARAWVRRSADCNTVNDNGKLRLGHGPPGSGFGTFINQAPYGGLTADTYVLCEMTYTVPATGVTHLILVAGRQHTVGTIHVDDVELTNITEAKAAADAAAVADAAARAAQLAAEASGAINRNPLLSDWPVGQALPTHWSSWTTNPARETALARTSVAARYNISATVQGGLQVSTASGLSPLPLGLEYVTVEVDLYLVSGASLAGAGVLLDWNGMAVSGAAVRAFLPFADAIPSPGLGKWYRVQQVIRRPAGATGTQTGWTSYVMGNYSTGLGALTAKDVIYDRVAYRPSSAAEVQAFLAAPSSSVTALEGIVNTKTTTFTQTSQPSTTSRTIGDEWIDTDDGNRRYTWTGAWTPSPIGTPALDPTVAGSLGQLMVDDLSNVSGWARKQGAGTLVAVAVTDSQSGGSVGRLTGGVDTRWARDDLRIPFDPSQLYRLRIRARQTVTGGAARMYAGLTAIDANGNALSTAGTADAIGNQHYLIASNVAVPAGLTEYVGYVQGLAAAGVTPNGAPSSDPKAPRQLRHGTRWMRPFLIANISGAATDVLEVDLFAIEAVPSGVVGPGNITATARELGATTVYYQVSQPGSGMVLGDFWLDTDDAQRTVRTYGPSGWEVVQNAAIVAALTAGQNAQSTANSKALIFAQPTMPVSGTPPIPPESLWVDTTVETRPDGTTGPRNRIWTFTSGAWADRRLGGGAIQPGSLVASDLLVPGTITAGLLEAIMVLSTTIVAGSLANGSARVELDGVNGVRLIERSSTVMVPGTSIGVDRVVAALSLASRSLEAEGASLSGAVRGASVTARTFLTGPNLLTEYSAAGWMGGMGFDPLPESWHIDNGQAGTIAPIPSGTPDPVTIVDENGTTLRTVDIGVEFTNMAQAARVVAPPFMLRSPGVVRKGQRYTLAFWARRAGATGADVPFTIQPARHTGTGAGQDSAWAPATIGSFTLVGSSLTWRRYSVVFTATADTDARDTIRFVRAAGGTMSYRMTAFSLTPGAAFVPFEYNGRRVEVNELGVRTFSPSGTPMLALDQDGLRSTEVVSLQGSQLMLKGQAFVHTSDLVDSIGLLAERTAVPAASPVALPSAQMYLDLPGLRAYGPIMETRQSKVDTNRPINTTAYTFDGDARFVNFYGPPSGKVVLHYAATGSCPTSGLHGTVDVVDRVSNAYVLQPLDSHSLQWTSSGYQSKGRSILVEGLIPGREYRSHFRWRSGAAANYERSVLIVAPQLG